MKIAKTDLITRFANGETIASIGQHYGLHNRRVEAVIREALVGVLALNEQLIARVPAETPAPLVTEEIEATPV